MIRLVQNSAVDFGDLPAVYLGTNSAQRTLESTIEDFQSYQEKIDCWRLADVPLGPIGGRFHLSKLDSEAKVGFLTGILNLDRTPFRLIHAGASLIVPGFSSRREFKAFAYMLALEGLIDPKRSEMQLGVTGRLEPYLCGDFR